LRDLPTQHAVRNQIGLCYLQAGKFSEAHEEFKKLTSKHPDVPLYWNNRGYSLKRRGDSLNDGDPQKTESYKQAKECFFKACELKSTSSQPYLAMSDIYLGEKNHEKALEWADKAIQADGQVDFQDFEAMFQLCKIHIYSENEEKIDEVVRRIISIVPDDSEYSNYVSARFKSIGEQLLEIQAFKSASHLLKGALTFSPNDESLGKLIEYTKKSALLLKEYEEFAKDRDIVEPLRKIGAVDYSGFFRKEVADRDELLDDAKLNIQMISIDSVLTSVELIKNKYPEIYRLNPDFYDKTEEDARKKQNELSGEPEDSKQTGQPVKECFLGRITGSIAKIFMKKS
jgi:tetratricopeptide (TPR) repeat protein